MCVYVTPKDNALQQNILVKKEDLFRLFFIIKKNVKRFAVYESLVCVRNYFIVANKFLFCLWQLPGNGPCIMSQNDCF